MRQYATFDCGMWDDPDGFVKLSAGAQRTYFMLVTQRDIGACGLLPLTLRRWASTTVDKGVDEWLAELEQYNYILIDENTEELLVRTFMKWDGGYKHAKRVQAVVASALAIRSQPIRRAALLELEKLSVRVPNREAIGSIRSVVTEVSTDHIPETRTQEREPNPSPREAADDPRSKFCPEHQPDGTDQDCGKCARRRESQDARARAQLEVEVEQRKAAKAAIDACDYCDEKGVRLHPISRLPLGRCDHETLEAVAS